MNKPSYDVTLLKYNFILLEFLRDALKTILNLVVKPETFSAQWPKSQRIMVQGQLFLDKLFRTIPQLYLLQEIRI